MSVISSQEAGSEAAGSDRGRPASSSASKDSPRGAQSTGGGQSEASRDQDAEDHIENIWQEHDRDVEKVLVNFRTINVYGEDRRFDPDDRIFELSGKPKRKSTLPEPDDMRSLMREAGLTQKAAYCRICEGEVSEKQKSKMCDFCGLNSCPSCA